MAPLQTGQSVEQREYVFGDFRLRPERRELLERGELVPVSRLAFDCIVYLVEHRQRAVGRDELVAAIWGRVDVSDGHLNQIIVRARRALGDRGDAQQLIRTVSGFGYRWVGDIAYDSPDLPSPPAQKAEDGRDSGPNGKHRRSSWLALGVMAVVLAVLSALWLRRPADTSPGAADEAAATPKEQGNAVVVLPIQISGPSESSWLSLGMMDLIAGRMRGAGLPVPPSETVVTALHGSSLSSDASNLDQARSVLGSAVTIQGKATRVDRGWVVALVSRDAAGSRHEVEARDEDAIRASRSAADLLLVGLGHEPPANAGSVDAVQAKLQQAQVALLTGRLDLARTLLTGIKRDETSNIEVSFKLAEVDFRAGRFEQTDAVLAKLLADPQIESDPLWHSRALILRGNLHYRRSAFTKAAGDFDAAIARLRPLSAPLDLCDALTRRGVVSVAMADFENASPVFGEARLLAEQMGDRLRVAHVDAGFGLLRLKQNRLELALPYLDAAISQFEAFGVVERVVTLLNAINEVYAALLRWTEAKEIGDRQWALRERIAEPGLLELVANRRGRQMVATGRFAEAEALLGELQQRFGDSESGTMRYMHDLEAELAWRKGQWERTIDAADRALKHWPRGPIYDRYAFLVLMRQRALIASGAAAPEKIDPWLPTADSDELSPVFWVALAERAAWQRQPADAETFFGKALKEAEADATPAKIALVAQSFGDWLLSEGRAGQAVDLAGQVAVWAREDFDCAILRVKVFHALGHTDTWAIALEQAKKLAGERDIAPGLLQPPSLAASAGPS